MTTNQTGLRMRMLAAGAAAALAMGIAAVPAAAADQPTTQQLMADCASGVGKCTFNDPVVRKAYLGNYRQVSHTLFNCSTSPAVQGMDWSDSVGSSDTLEVSVTVGGKIAGIVDASVTATYGHTWEASHSEGGSLSMTVQPGEVGWISRAQVMHQVSGTWQTHYDNPHWGHYYWYWKDTVTSPAPSGTDGVGNSVVVKSRPMTAAEKESCTATARGPRPGPGLHRDQPSAARDAVPS
ncbi:hypothetical protein GCM10009760_41500 [Kitasatospora kazusensis]|uniref:Secreted protein n=1 Tax=Kitasatospora kazusensis TaxID=407974 RepID=A0ABP5LLS2_9ACTN